MTTPDDAAAQINEMRQAAARNLWPEFVDDNWTSDQVEEFITLIQDNLEQNKAQLLRKLNNYRRDRDRFRAVNGHANGHANGAGNRPALRIVNDDNRDELIRNMGIDIDEIDLEGRAARKVTPESFLYNNNTGRYIFLPTGSELNDRNVDKMIPVTEWRIVNVQGDERPVPPSIDLAQSDFGRTIDGRVWEPGAPQIIKGKKVYGEYVLDDPEGSVLNEYVAPQEVCDDWKGDVSKYEKHIEGLIPDIRERRHLLDRMAYVVQHPGKKINGVFVIHGPQGGGKDTALWPLSKWLGPVNFKTVEGDDVSDKWTGWAECCVALINETSSSDKSSIAMYESLKPFAVTPPDYIPVKRKYKESLQVKNCVVIFTTTNHPYSLYMEDNERRLIMVESLKSEDDWPEGYFVELYDWMESGGWKAIIHWLKQRDLSNYNPKAKIQATDSKLRLRSLISAVRRDPVDDLIDEFIQEEMKWGVQTDVIIAADMIKYIEAKDDAGGRIEIEAKLALIKAIRSRSFPHKMREHGYYSFTVDVKDGKLKQIMVKGVKYSGVYIADRFNLKEAETTIIDTLSRREIPDYLSRFGTKPSDKEAKRGDEPF